MASVNKASLREEFATLKGQFEALCAEGKVTAEIRALVQALLMLFELLMAVLLEKHTPKSSRNSSLPPSQTGKEDDTATRPGTQAKGQGHTHTRSGNTRTLETVTILPLATCAHCGAALGDLPPTDHERRTRIDLLFETQISHLDAEIKDCPHCHRRSKAPFPADIAGPVQYGPGIRAYVLNLLLAQMISLKRVQQSIQTLIGRLLSEATLLHYVMQLHRALAAWEQASIAQLLTQPALHVDETSLRVDRNNHWIHVYSAGDLTLKVLHRKRGKEAIEAIGIIPRYQGTAIHDGWASYLSYEHVDHGLCGSHLLRELTFVVETNAYRWAHNMKRLLKQTP